VLGVVAALSMVTGVLFGLAPALQSTRGDFAQTMKESRPDSRRHGPLNLSRILIVSQIVIALFIVVAAGLFTRTLSNLASIDLGFNADNLLTFEVDARQAGHRDSEIVTFYERLQKEFSGIPGVRSVTLSRVALIGGGVSGTNFGLSGEGLPGGAIQNSRSLEIGTGFFRTVGVPILRGRDIDERDRKGTPMVAVVNEVFAKRSFGDRNPLGQHLTMPRMCPKCDIEIVGVSANSLYGSLKRAAPPIVYLPVAQGAWGPVSAMSFELRTAANPLGYVRAVREIVHRADDRLPIADLKSQRELIDESINQEITFARLCGAFALLALAIACVGLYGTMSYNVARRTGEIGIRMALGAQRRKVIGMILREVMVLVAVGLAISLPAALAASTVVKSFLFGMKPNDPLAMAGAVATLGSAAILAGYLPARRASRIDPMAALRHE
jgi:predicted permease